MKGYFDLACILIIATVLSACAVPTATPTLAPPISKSSLRPGTTFQEMTVDTAQDQAGEPSIFDTCSPIITETDASVIVRECSVPQMPVIFVGYGDFASSQEELDALWESETWAMYIDGHPVALDEFGVFDIDWEGNRLRQWNVTVHNLTPGQHAFRYVIGRVDNSREPTDATWTVTVGEASQSSPTPTSGTLGYPPLTSTVASGQNPYSSQTARLNFLLYVPSTYGKDPLQAWPLILYLHGAGERGDNLDNLKTGGLPKRLEGQTDFPAIVLSPQGNGEYEFWAKDQMVNSLLMLMQEVQSRYSIDPNRIYLTGVSAGGNGTWEIGVRHPDLFAALVPVAGYFGYPFTVPENICDLKDVPVWAFHGAKDETIPIDAEESLVNALKACGGNVQFTVYPDDGHGISSKTYATPELYSWLLSQTLR